MTDFVIFDRAFTVTIGTIKITQESLRVAFQVTKSLKAEPNKATVNIYNLNEDHIGYLERAQSVPVQIEAGYRDHTSVIFLGDLRGVQTHKEDTDIVTVIGGGDGEVATQTSRVNISISKGTPTSEVLKKVAKAIGVSPGNLDQAVSSIQTQFSNAGSAFTTGTVLTGNAAREMSAICRSLDLEWSIQGGKLQILERGKALAGQAIKLGGPSGHGMIGSPSVDGKGVLSFSMALLPDVYPGRLLVLDAERLKGQYRITDTEHSGDLYADWKIDGKAEKY
jgi:hypothetical protein